MVTVNRRRSFNRTFLLLSTPLGFAFFVIIAWRRSGIHQCKQAVTGSNGSGRSVFALLKYKDDRHSTPGLLPLTELAGSSKKVACPEVTNLKAVYDTVLDASEAYKGGRKIPKVVHVTSKSRCMHEAFVQNLDKWRFEGYSFFMHDDEAMDLLLFREWPEFPHLHKLLQCLEFGGAVKADIWRLLVLYAYGGIYT
jgi:mannosyltransferase OCH1-like enzyme